jgi:hypothetical protein
MRNPIADVVKRVPSAYHSQPELGGYPKQTVYFISFNKIDSWYLFVVQLQLQLYDPVMARDMEAP